MFSPRLFKYLCSSQNSRRVGAKRIAYLTVTCQYSATLKHVVYVLDHDALHILQLCVDAADVSSAVCQLLFRLLYVHVKLYECIRPRH